MKKTCFFSILFASVLLISSCNDSSGSTIISAIKYEVTGTIPYVDIDYHNFTGETDSFKNVPLPWEKSFSVAINHSDFFSTYLYVRNFSTSGSFSANIYVNDVLVKTSTISGSYPSSSLNYVIWNY